MARAVGFAFLLAIAAAVAGDARHAFAGCGDYLVRNGRPVVPGHGLRLPATITPFANLARGEHDGLPVVPRPRPCDGVHCGHQAPAPLPSVPSVQLRTGEQGVFLSPAPSAPESLWTAQLFDHGLVGPDAFSLPLERPPKS